MFFKVIIKGFVLVLDQKLRFVDFDDLSTVLGVNRYYISALSRMSCPQEIPRKRLKKDSNWGRVGYEVEAVIRWLTICACNVFSPSMEAALRERAWKNFEIERKHFDAL